MAADSHVGASLLLRGGNLEHDGLHLNSQHSTAAAEPHLDEQACVTCLNEQPGVTV